MRVLRVAAVSSPQQMGDDKFSVDDQLHSQDTVVAARNWTIAGTVIIPGHSRNYEWLDELKDSCPEYREIVDHWVRGRLVDLIIVYAYDRLWRTDALRAQVTAVCRQNGVQIFSVMQPVEPTDPRLLTSAANSSSRMMEILFGAFAEMDNRARTERVRAGRAARVRERGLPVKSRFLWYGYRRDPESYIAVDPEQAVWVKWMYERCAYDRWGPVRIAESLDQQGIPRPTPQAKRWYNGVVSRILSNPLYKGTLVWAEVTNENSRVPPIVSDQLWELVQTVREHRAGTRRRQTYYPLTGLVRCAQCGYAMAYTWYTDKRSGRRYHWLRCGHYISTRGHECASNYTSSDAVEQIVMDQVHAVLRDEELWAELRGESNGSEEKITDLKAAIQELDNRWERWNRAYETSAITVEEMLLHRQRIFGERDALTAQVERLLSSTARDEAAAEAREALVPLLDELPSLPPDALNRVYNHLIKEIHVAPGKPPSVDITFL